MKEDFNSVMVRVDSMAPSRHQHLALKAGCIRTRDRLSITRSRGLNRGFSIRGVGSTAMISLLYWQFQTAEESLLLGLEEDLSRSLTPCIIAINCYLAV